MDTKQKAVALVTSLATVGFAATALANIPENAPSANKSAADHPKVAQENKANQVHRLSKMHFVQMAWLAPN